MDTFGKIADAQGWDEARQLDIVLDFIDRKRLWHELDVYARHRAAAENGDPIEE